MGKGGNCPMLLLLSEAFKSPGRALLRVVTQAIPSGLRFISPCSFGPLCLVYEMGVWCVLLCWAGLAWLEDAALAEVVIPSGAGASLHCGQGS